MPPNFPALRAGISPETGEKAQHFPARAPTRRAKRPDIFRHYTRRETHHQISPHMEDLGGRLGVKFS